MATLYETHTGTSTDNYQTFTFTTKTKRVDIINRGSNSIAIRANYDKDDDNLGYEDEFYVFAGIMETPLSCNGIILRSAAAGQQSEFTLVGWIRPTKYD